MERNFLRPHALKKNEKTGLEVVDLDNSEEFRLLEAIGQPKVFYALKANKYFKDAECLKEYDDKAISEMGLPIPIQIETARRKLIKEANDSGQTIDRMALLRATAPQTLNPPSEINDRLVKSDPVERMIARINRSTLGK